MRSVRDSKGVPDQGYGCKTLANERPDTAGQYWRDRGAGAGRGHQTGNLFSLRQSPFLTPCAAPAGALLSLSNSFIFYDCSDKRSSSLDGLPRSVNRAKSHSPQGSRITSQAKSRCCGTAPARRRGIHRVGIVNDQANRPGNPCCRSRVTAVPIQGVEVFAARILQKYRFNVMSGLGSTARPSTMRTASRRPDLSASPES